MAQLVQEKGCADHQPCFLLLRVRSRWVGPVISRACFGTRQAANVPVDPQLPSSERCLPDVLSSFCDAVTKRRVKIGDMKKPCGEGIKKNMKALLSVD